jgi:hypothetical protein
MKGSFADPVRVQAAFDRRRGRQSKLSLLARLWCLAAENAAYAHLGNLLEVLTIVADQYKYGPRDGLSRESGTKREVALTDKVAAKAKARDADPCFDVLLHERFERALNGRASRREANAIADILRAA